jgi:hypothetical protein
MKHLFALLTLAAPLLAGAQHVQQQAAAAVSPSVPVPPVPYAPMAPVGASTLVQALDDWKGANATVGQYPRGHLDVIKWERAQDAARPASPATPEPAR